MALSLTIDGPEIANNLIPSPSGISISKCKVCNTGDVEEPAGTVIDCSSIVAPDESVNLSTIVPADDPAKQRSTVFNVNGTSASKTNPYVKAEVAEVPTGASKRPFPFIASSAFASTQKDVSSVIFGVVKVSPVCNNSPPSSLSYHSTIPEV